MKDRGLLLTRRTKYKAKGIGTKRVRREQKRLSTKANHERQEKDKRRERQGKQRKQLKLDESWPEKTAWEKNGKKNEVGKVDESRVAKSLKNRYDSSIPS
jgi:hypothetical protein